MSIRKYLVTGALSSLAVVAAPASAAVYTFVSAQTRFGSIADTFTLTLSSPITGNATFQRSQFDVSTGEFDRAEFCLAGTQCILGNTNATYDEITLFPPSSGTSGPAAVSVSYDFRAPAFNANGSYRTVAGAPGTLQVIAGAVPEPATWAMMLLGFGMVGGAARYRRRGANISFA